MGRYSALLVGASTYEIPGIPSLPFVVEDLNRLAGVLQCCGFQVSQLRSGRQFGANFINGEVRGFLRRARDGDMLFILLSGHGVHACGQDYLIPEDAHPDITPFESGCVAIDWKDELVKTRAERVVICIDACREGIEQDSMGPLVNVRSWGTRKADRALRRKVAYVYACSAGQPALFVRPEDPVLPGRECGTEPGDSFSLFSRAVGDVFARRDGSLDLQRFRDSVQARVDELHCAYDKKGSPQELRIVTDVVHLREFSLTPTEAADGAGATEPHRDADSGVGTPTPPVVGSSPGISRRQVLLAGAGVGAAAGMGYAFWPRSDIDTAEKPSSGDGAKLWKFTTGGRVESSPAVFGGTVFVSSQDRHLYAVDIRTGRQNWKSPIPVGLKYSSPAVADGMAYLGGYDKNLYAMDADTGKHRWIFSAGDEIDSSPTVADGAVYFQDKSGIVYAVDAATGVKRWEFDSEVYGISLRPVVSEGVLYMPCYKSDAVDLYALDVRTGGERWHARVGVDELQPIVADGFVYVGGGSEGMDLYCVDARTGQQKWVFPTDGLVETPAAADGIACIGNDSGNLFAVDARTGKQRWRARTGREVVGDPAVAKGVVYVGLGVYEGEFDTVSDLTLHAFSAHTGKRIWVFPEGSLAAPTVAGGVLYMGAGDSLYAVRA